MFNSEVIVPSPSPPLPSPPTPICDTLANVDNDTVFDDPLLPTPDVTFDSADGENESQVRLDIYIAHPYMYIYLQTK